jgi:hypothetical protein
VAAKPLHVSLVASCGPSKSHYRPSFLPPPSGSSPPGIRHNPIAPFSTLENLVAEICLPIGPVRAGVAIKLLRVGKQYWPSLASVSWSSPSFLCWQWSRRSRVTLLHIHTLIHTLILNRPSFTSLFIPFLLLLFLLPYHKHTMAEVMREKDATRTNYSSENSSPPATAGENELVNASGHVQEVDRKYVQD